MLSNKDNEPKGSGKRLRPIEESRNLGTSVFLDAPRLPTNNETILSLMRRFEPRLTDAGKELLDHVNRLFHALDMCALIAEAIDREGDGSVPESMRGKTVREIYEIACDALKDENAYTDGKQRITAIVPREIDRAKHRHVLDVWNKCMENAETLEMTWPKLVAAFIDQ